MKISFCTTCMGRAHHLKETLPQNIRDNIDGRADVEFVVLNYNSGDDLHEWIMTDRDMARYMEMGVLRYGVTTEPQHFHMAHAKNMAHRMATGDVVCNVDADNFTGTGFADYLARVFREDSEIVVNPSHIFFHTRGYEDGGYYGRVAISRDNFLRLHGYDENLRGWGGDDTDFLQRAKGMGLKHLKIGQHTFISVIRHSNESRVEHMAEGEEREEMLQTVNAHKSADRSIVTKLFNKMKVLAIPVQANRNGSFGAGTVTMNDGQELEFGSVTEGNFSPFNICAWGLPELLRGRLSPRIIPEPGEESLDGESLLHRMPEL
ncbi:MAG: glycosyltransferase family 2 protein [Alphaproteobacteria bacterium]|nr:glycosyltransferase family 2 protein [Alphaproteobacteria bacterium]